MNDLADPAPTAVEKYFFTPIYHPGSAWSVVRWWESRRPLFNLCVGGAGLASLGTGLLLSPGVVVPWGGMFVFGVMANLGYSLGAPIDLLLRRVLGDRAPAVGPVLLRYGFVFSIGLALLPIPLFAVGWLLRHVVGI